MSELIGFKQEEKTEFELSGLNADELGFMRADERRAVIEAAGLNPDEYDFEVILYIAVVKVDIKIDERVWP